MLNTPPRPPVPTLPALMLPLLLCACSSAPTSPPAPAAPIPPLPLEARQPAPLTLCSPTCSAGWSALLDSLRLGLTLPRPPAGPASGPTGL